MRWWEIEEAGVSREPKPWMLKVIQQAEDMGLNTRLEPDNKRIYLGLPNEVSNKLKALQQKYGVFHSGEIGLPMAHGTWINSLKDAKKYLEQFKTIMSNLDNLENIAQQGAQEKGMDDIFGKFAERSQSSSVRKNLQLMIPKPGETETIWAKHDKNRSWIYGYDDDGNEIKKESIGSMIRGNVSKTGFNKPTGPGLLWTSSASKTSNGWTSEWNEEFLKHTKKWWSPKGHLFRIKPEARILEIQNSIDSRKIYQAYKKLGRVKPTDYKFDFENESDIIKREFPWDEIQKHWDGVYTPMNDYQDEFLYGWDVESCVWFDPSSLQYLGEVRIKDPSNGDDDDL